MFLHSFFTLNYRGGKNNVFLMASYEGNGRTIIEFKRKLVTNDPFDVAIQKNMQCLLLYAIGPTDPPNNDYNSLAMHTTAAFAVIPVFWPNQPPIVLEPGIQNPPNETFPQASGGNNVASPTSPSFNTTSGNSTSTLSQIGNSTSSTFPTTGNATNNNTAHFMNTTTSSSSSNSTNSTNNTSNFGSTNITSTIQPLSNNTVTVLPSNPFLATSSVRIQQNSASVYSSKMTPPPNSSSYLNFPMITLIASLFAFQFLIVY